jgi:hypothetical protein
MHGNEANRNKSMTKIRVDVEGMIGIWVGTEGKEVEDGDRK